MFAIVSAFILSCASQIRTASSMCAIPPIKQVSFKQRRNYSEVFATRRSKRTTELFEAVFMVSSDVFYMLARCIRRLSTQPSTEADQRKVVDDVLQYVHYELDDLDFRNEVKNFGVLLEEEHVVRQPIAYPDFMRNVQICDWLFNTWTSILLMRTILEGPTILQGLENPKIAGLARSLVASCQFGKACYSYDENYGIQNYDTPHLMIAGTGLGNQDDSERISRFEPPNILLKFVAGSLMS